METFPLTYLVALSSPGDCVAAIFSLRGDSLPTLKSKLTMKIKRRLAALSIVLFLTSTPLQGQLTLDEGATISFASAVEGKAVLTSRDDFVKRMSPFDRAARLKTNKDVSERQYLEFVSQNVLEWSDSEKGKINSVLKGIEKNLAALALPLPDQVFLIKTTGKEEGGAAYTRGNAVVLPQAKLKTAVVGIQMTICHELFHIISREHPDLREKFYAAIGFARCHEVEFPQALKSKKITNPDAPRNNHCIRVKVSGNDQWAIPILFSDTEKYDTDRGGEFFDSLQFQLLLVERPDDGLVVSAMMEGPKPKLVAIQEVSGFFEQVGRNTGYIIHPEEILADNFALWVMRQGELPSPQIIEKMKVILETWKATGKAAAAGADQTRR